MHRFFLYLGAALLSAPAMEASDHARHRVTLNVRAASEIRASAVEAPVQKPAGRRDAPSVRVGVTADSPYPRITISSPIPASHALRVHIREGSRTRSLLLSGTGKDYTYASGSRAHHLTMRIGSASGTGTSSPLPIRITLTDAD